MGAGPSKFSMSNPDYDGVSPHSRTTWRNVTVICPSALSFIYFLVYFLSFCMKYLSKPQIWLDHASAQNPYTALNFPRIKPKPLAWYTSTWWSDLAYSLSLPLIFHSLNFSATSNHISRNFLICSVLFHGVSSLHYKLHSILSTQLKCQLLWKAFLY